MKLKQGQRAPHFIAEDVAGRPIDLNDYIGYKTMVSFYRFSSCPFCNLRIQSLLRRYHSFEEQGLKMISIWQSPKESLLQHVGELHAPFPMIPDPNKLMYRKYHVEPSWGGTLKILKAPKLMAQAIKQGFNPTTVDGDMNQLPADFLLNPDLTIHQAYYGEHIGDHINFGAIDRFLADEWKE